MTKLDEFKNYHTMVVHNGVFHADDVFAVATVNIICDKLSLPRLRIMRLNDDQLLNHPEYTEENGYLVADIGHGRFDHHFPDGIKERRENNIPYAAFGLIMREYYSLIMDDKMYKLIDTHFIASIDYHDNDGTGNHISAAISAFNPAWNEDESPYVFFRNAVEVAEKILYRQIIKSHTYTDPEIPIIAEKMAETAENGVVYMDRFAPIHKYMTDKSSIFFVGHYDPARGSYQVCSIRDADGNNKMLFPENIRGVSNATNPKYKPDGMIFCHPSGFVAGFDDKEAAKKFMNEFMSK